MARAIWKGELLLGDERVPVKMYSAVQDRKVHFRLLHAKDDAPVEQQIVRKDNGKEVPREDRRKALPLDDGSAVILQPDELERLEPPASREIRLCRFVPPRQLGEQWHDRPYLLGPDDDAAVDDYFALAAALERAKAVGIARWVMRKKRYLGALAVLGGYLTLTTLRRADQVLRFEGIAPQKSTTPADKELKLAEQLVSMISADFDPRDWEDEYHQRLCKLIEAKARGEKLRPLPRRKRDAGASLADSLRMSLAAARQPAAGARREKRVA